MEMFNDFMISKSISSLKKKTKKLLNQLNDGNIRDDQTSINIKKKN